MAISGSATISAGDTYITVNHNLGHTPDENKIVVKPRDDLGGRSYWRSNVTGTTFRININTQDLTDHVFAYIIFDSVWMRWIQCPYCGEIDDLRRVGSTGKISTKPYAKAAPKQQDRVYEKISHSKIVECGFCGKQFRTDGATRREVMGGATYEVL